MKHLIKIDISSFPSFVDQHLVGGSVYVNHFLLLGVSPLPPTILLVFEVRPHFTGWWGVNQKLLSRRTVTQW